MARGGIFKEKKDQRGKNKKHKVTGNAISSNAPVFILPKIVERKKRE